MTAPTAFPAPRDAGPPSALWPAALPLAASLAVALPLLLPLATVPDPVLLHQLAAAFGWGLWLVVASWAHAGAPGAWRRAPLAGVLAGFGLLALLAARGGQATSAAGLLAAAAVLAGTARLAASPGQAAALARPVAWAWGLAGLGCSLVAAWQFLRPDSPAGGLVSLGSTLGRAVGNMRQPNHLATALLLALIWTAWAWGDRQRRRPLGPLGQGLGLLAVAMILLALAMSASRTGALGLLLLAAWGALDRRLPRPLRGLLLLTPLLYGLAWMALSAWSEAQGAAFYAERRLAADGDLSSSRFAIWHDTLALIAQHPIAGVGWGRFNLAWTFSAFPARPLAFFDHCHNLPLQLAVELGLPLTALLLGGLAWALWRGRGVLAAPDPEGGLHPARAALVMGAMLALHSQLEYPLWYLYFLLPAAWALGLMLGGAGPAEREPGPAAAPPGPGPAGLLVSALGLGLMAGALLLGADHRRLEAIYRPLPGDPPLAQRIAAGQASLWFGHHADHAASTQAPEAVPLARFGRALDHLIDLRLLAAYARALQAHGLEAEARSAAARLREFSRRPDAARLLPLCPADAALRATPPPAPEALGPWACEPPARALDWQALRAPAR